MESQLFAVILLIPPWMTLVSLLQFSTFSLMMLPLISFKALVARVLVADYDFDSPLLYSAAALAIATTVVAFTVAIDCSERRS